MSNTDADTLPPTLGALTAASLRVGCLGFGGPAGQIALMHRIFVEEKKWLDEPEFLHLLNFCMLLPGPEAQQLATYAGWRLQGITGGVIAGALFVIPGALVVFALSWLYAALGQTPHVSAMFLGIKAAVIALIIEALFKVGKRALKTRADLAIAAFAFAALFLFALPFPLVIACAAAFGLATSLGKPPLPAETASFAAQPDVAAAFRSAIVWGVIWLAPLSAAWRLLGPNHVLTEVGVLFSKLAVVTFGGAYAVLAYLQQEAVEAEGWLTAPQMIDGLGLAETTPGPLVLVNQFVGFMAGWQTDGGGLALAAAAALMASWCTFAPSFVWIFAGAPFADALRRSRLASSALKAITAAVFGIIAKIAIVFSFAVLFRESTAATLPWSTRLSLPAWASIDLLAVAIASGAAVALIRNKANILFALPLCAIAGLVGMFFPPGA